MTDSTRQALRILAAACDNRPWQWGGALCGRSMVKARQAIMSALLGRKATQAESGINALYRELVSACDIERNCTAVEEREIAEIVCRECGIPTHQEWFSAKYGKESAVLA